MRLTIIPEDKTVVVDGVGRMGLEFTYPQNVRVLQWYDTEGVLEGHDYVNTKITSIPQWALNAVSALNTQLEKENIEPEPDPYESYLKNIHAQYPEANNKSIQALLNQRYPGFTYRPMMDVLGRKIIGIESGLIIGDEGINSFRQAVKLMKKLGVPVFSDPYPEDPSTYESFKTYLQAQGMVVHEGEGFRYTYLPWNLEMAKARKNTQISYDIEETLNTEPFEFNGKQYDVDEKSRIVITQKATQISIDNFTGDVYWRLYTNNTVPVPAQEFLDMASALTSYVESLYGLSWQRKAQVETATTEAELELI